jgi:hypothetical protein
VQNESLKGHKRQECEIPFVNKPVAKNHGGIKHKFRFSAGKPVFAATVS